MSLCTPCNRRGRCIQNSPRAHVCPRENTNKTSEAPGLRLEVFSAAAAGLELQCDGEALVAALAGGHSNPRPHPSGTGRLALWMFLDIAFDTKESWEGEALGWVSNSQCSGISIVQRCKEAQTKLTRERPGGWERPLLGNLCAWTAVGSVLCWRHSAHPAQSSVPICPLIKAMPHNSVLALLISSPLPLGNFLPDGQENPQHAIACKCTISAACF